MAYPDEKLAHVLNTTFVPVRVDLHKEEALARKYGVSWAPWLDVLDEEGNVVAQTLGPLSAEDFLRWLDQAIQEVPRFQETLEKLRAHPDDVALNLQSGEGWLRRGNWAKALECLKTARKGLGADPSTEGAAVFTALGRAAVMSGDEPALKDALNRLEACKGDKSPIVLQTAYSSFSAGDYAEAKKRYNAFLKEYPSRPGTPEAWYWLGAASSFIDGDTSGLIVAWMTLIASAKDNEWARRAEITLRR